jgi:hypothetical protein
MYAVTRDHAHLQEDSNWPLDDPSALKKKFDEIFDATRHPLSLRHPFRCTPAPTLPHHSRTSTYGRTHLQAHPCAAHPCARMHGARMHGARMHGTRMHGARSLGAVDC